MNAPEVKPSGLLLPVVADPAAVSEPPALLVGPNRIYHDLFQVRTTVLSVLARRMWRLVGGSVEHTTRLSRTTRSLLCLLYLQEIQLVSTIEFEPRTRMRLGGLVTAKSVKYLGKLASKLAGQVRRRVLEPRATGGTGRRIGGKGKRCRRSPAGNARRLVVRAARGGAVACQDAVVFARDRV